jgi:AcrR family transcriptional regulator
MPLDIDLILYKLNRIMATTRSYNSENRLRKQAELRARIAAAAAALHARKGALATSYADIAAEARVSLPTVYAHFPTMDDLLTGCTRHVAGRAPTLPVAEILGAPKLEEAAERLVDAMEQQHLHFEPWLSWRENRVIPFLADLAGRVRDERAALIARVLRRHCGPGNHREAVAAWETALSFDAWHRLARGHRLSRPAARRATLQCLLATAPPQARTNTHRSKT